MKKQGLAFSLGLGLFLFAALPTSVNAGSSPAPGASNNSSTSTGGTFAPVPPPTPAPGTNVTVGANGQLTVPPAVQVNVNRVAAAIVRANPSSVVVVIITRGTGANAAINQVRTVIVNVGVSPARVQALVNALTSLFRGSNRSATVPSELLVASGTLENLQLAQSETPVVDVNQLNAAINAYNEIIRTSDTATLRRLAQNQEFLEIGRVLRELRAALVAGK
ncbi:hypothetical protein [Calothrix sp. NIES-3974]|uniref:hypothetical protein n=1 Tax=Calothrix sp. NIES-3974 TaxID=2005462 RepID=UPI000B615FF6|nr:hypothetical protein [Calothrix sp. NIES-3974]BAZ05981.1 hypothetical protein NIES3974_26380 [Calothrix sp. NIES-3974]